MLGDFHNLGRRVRLDPTERFLLKPRTTLWEWLLLDERSSLRQILRRVVPTLPGAHLGHFPLAGISVEIADDSTFAEARVERLSCSVDEPFLETVEDAWALGSAVAIASWLGIGDLHHGNVRAIRTSNGTLTLAFLDIEVILNDFTLPSETMLISRAKHFDPGTGLAKILESPPPTRRPVLALTATQAFVSTIDSLEKHSVQIFQLIGTAISRHPAIAYARVLARATSDYAKFIVDGVKPVDPFAPCEAAQLSRGDIRYFLRFLDDSTIYWLADNASLDQAYFQPKLMSKTQSPFLIVAEGNATPRRRAMLRAGGALQVLSSMGPLSEGQHSSLDASLEVTQSSIRLTTPTLRVVNEAST